MQRSETIAEFKKGAEQLIYEEKLPMISEILEYALQDKTSPDLQHVFDFFDDKEEFTNLIRRKSVHFSQEESREFLESVIAANISDISLSGTLYKNLMAAGDTYRIKGTDCESQGTKYDLPMSEHDFAYQVKDSWFTVEDEKERFMVDNYEDFIKATKDKKYIYVRSPLSCKYFLKRSCCPICAGRLPEKVQNIGAFAALMITEVATQNALSSMNKGRKVNVNTLLSHKAENIKTMEDFYAWVNTILEDLKGNQEDSVKVERRFFELALLGRLYIVDGKPMVLSLKSPIMYNYFGNFIYKGNETTFRQLVNHPEFNDSSLKAQIAFNCYKKGIF